MKKFLNKAKDSYKDFQDNQSGSGAQQPIQQPNQPVNLGPPTPNDVLRYRYHHGTNLGSIFGISPLISPLPRYPSFTSHHISSSSHPHTNTPSSPRKMAPRLHVRAIRQRRLRTRRRHSSRQRNGPRSRPRKVRTALAERCIRF